MIYIEGRWLIGAFLAGIHITTLSAADLTYGEYLAGECVACHNAKADATIPSINDLPPPYFAEALREYREGERDHDLMRNVARSLGKAEVEALAAYFAQLDR